VAISLSLRAYIIELYLCTVIAAHLARDKTLQKLKARFYWPGMTKDIRNYVQKCSKCKMRKTPSRQMYGKMKPINPYASSERLSPGDFISADL